MTAAIKLHLVHPPDPGEQTTKPTDSNPWASGFRPVKWFNALVTSGRFSKLPGSAQRVVAVLLAHADGDGRCWPGYGELTALELSYYHIAIWHGMQSHGRFNTM